MVPHGTVDGKRPDECPKGHPIWWFHSRWQDKGRTIWYGICSGQRIGDRIKVAGQCRHTWLWQGQELKCIQGFSVETVLEALRCLASECDRFTLSDVDNSTDQDS